MQGSLRIIDLLNKLLSLELRAINQYFTHYKVCQNRATSAWPRSFASSRSPR